MSLAHVKAFYEKLAKDESFRTQIQGVSSKEECGQIVKAAGYDFTTAEFEEYTVELLESATAEEQLQYIGEKELAAIFGGLSSAPLYGVVRPNVQPLYGVVQ